MSFLTEYFDEFRQHPIRKTKICRPENRWAKLEGKWLDPKKGTEDKVWTEEEIEQFIQKTMKSLRGQSTYYNEYCAHLSQDFKTRPFKPREKKQKRCVSKEQLVEEEDVPALGTGPKLALKDTELMKMAKEMYERDMDEPTLEPLQTHFRRPEAGYDAKRFHGYIRPCLFKTGISEYQHGIARLAYELIRDDRLPRFHAHNGCRATWGLPPEGVRQPELDGIPLDGERLF